MSFYDEITNFMSGGKQQGAQELEEMLRQGLSQLQNYGQQGAGYLSPFRDAGLGQLGNLQKAIGGMMNPTQYYGDIMSHYQQSPAAQRQHEMGLNDAMSAASASGMTGSSDLLRQVNEQSQNITNQDMQKYFGNIMGINNEELGLSQGLYNTGFGASGSMAELMGNLGKAIAQMYGNIGKARQAGDEASTGGLANWLQGGMNALSKIPIM